ncbi:MAG: PAS domain S-box protein, partial [Armatimonadota bacterium]
MADIGQELGFGLAGLVGIMYLIAVRVLLTGYATAERRGVEKDLVVVQQLLAQRMDDLDAQCHDWSSWDETYAFAKDLNSGYRARNLHPSSLSILKTNLVAYVDRSGRVLYGGWYDFDHATITPLPSAFESSLAPRGALLRHPRLDEGQRGLLNSPWGLLMVASRPILDSAAHGPSRGTLIFGRPLGSGELYLIQRATQLAVRTIPLAAGQWPRELQPLSARLTGAEEIASQVEGPDVVAGYTALCDVGGHPVALLRVAEPRDIYHRGLLSVRQMLLPAVLFGVALSLVLLFTLEHLVLARIAKLGAAVAAVGESGDATRRVALSGKDELADLATRINGTLEALAHSRGQLQESERSYRDQFANNSAVMLLIDPAEGAIIDANAAAVSFYGYPRERLLAMCISDLNTLPASEIRENMVSVPQQQGKRFEFQHRLADASVRDVEVSVSSIQFDGCPVLHSIIHDITERKQAEEALRARTALLEAQTNATLDGILVIDEDDKRILVNQRWIELASIPPEVLADENDSALLRHVRGLTKNPEAFIERISYLNAHPAEVSRDEVEFKSGMILDRHSAPVLGKDGKYYGRIWTFRDITERKQTEAALRESEQQHRDLVETSSDWVWQVDEQAVYTYVSPRVREILGYEPEQVLGKTPFDFMEPAERARMGAVFGEIVARRAAFSLLENTTRHLDGSAVVAETSGVPIFDASGAFRGYRGVDRDITERKQAEAYGALGRDVLQILNEPGDLQASLQRVLGALRTRTGFD